MILAEDFCALVTKTVISIVKCMNFHAKEIFLIRITGNNIDP